MRLAVLVRFANTLSTSRCCLTDSTGDPGTTGRNAVLDFPRGGFMQRVDCPCKVWIAVDGRATHDGAERTCLFAIGAPREITA